MAAGLRYALLSPDIRTALLRARVFGLFASGLTAMFNVVVQLSAPRWVVGRSMAATQMVLFAGFAAGSLGWGASAGALGLSWTLALGGLGVAASALLGLRFPIATPKGVDVTAPGSANAEEPRAAAFVCQIWDLRGVRRRAGGRRWAILRDGCSIRWSVRPDRSRPTAATGRR